MAVWSCLNIKVKELLYVCLSYLTSGTYLKKLKGKINGIFNAIVIWVYEHFLKGQTRIIKQLKNNK